MADFDTLWTRVNEGYAYFDVLSSDWGAVRTLYRDRAAEAGTLWEFVTLLEEVLRELYDPHAHLRTNTASSPRLLPSDTDVWGVWVDGRARVEEVRPGSAADSAGVRRGDEIVAIGGRTAAESARTFLPRSLHRPDPRADEWALNAAIAGRRDQPVRLCLRRGGSQTQVHFIPRLQRPGAPITSALLPGDIAYVRIHNSLGDPGLIAAWDSTLLRLRSARGMILDLRDTPGGGNTTVARGIMGRLVGRDVPYQRHELPSEHRETGIRRGWVEHVYPRGPFQFRAPLLVLVGRWTGSMGEGIAVGLDGMRRGRVVGSRMAGLLGATYAVRLPRTGLVANIPSERLFHLDGRRRETFTPQRFSDLALGDPLANAARGILQSSPSRATPAVPGKGMPASVACGP